MNTSGKLLTKSHESKKILCVNLLNGKCMFGKKCAFSHDRSLIRNLDIVQPKTVRMYKSELCKVFAEGGNCKFGDRCQFAHGKEELRNVPRPEKYKTRKCKKFFEEGICLYGSRCHFLHTEKSDDSCSSLMKNNTLPLLGFDSMEKQTMQEEIQLKDLWSLKISRESFFDCDDDASSIDSNHSIWSISPAQSPKLQELELGSNQEQRFKIFI
jgi:hypothetical protein